jgi:hypothetical protein
MTLGRKIVDLIRLHLLNDPDQIRSIGQIAVVESEPNVPLMRILVQVVDAVSIEERCATLDAMNLIALRQEQFGEICPVLSRYAGNQRFLSHSGRLLVVRNACDRS